MKKNCCFFNKSHVGTIFLILVFVLGSLLMSYELGTKSRSPILTTDVAPIQKSALNYKVPFSFDWNGNTMYLSCKVNVDFVVKDGSQKKRNGKVMHKFVFAHVSLTQNANDVQEQNLFLGWLDTSLETKVFLYTKADNKKIDYLLYKLSPKGEKVILQEGTFSA